MQLNGLPINPNGLPAMDASRHNLQASLCCRLVYGASIETSISSEACFDSVGVL